MLKKIKLEGALFRAIERRTAYLQCNHIFGCDASREWQRRLNQAGRNACMNHRYNECVLYCCDHCREPHDIAPVTGKAELMHTCSPPSRTIEPLPPAADMIVRHWREWCEAVRDNIWMLYSPDVHEHLDEQVNLMLCDEQFDESLLFDFLMPSGCVGFRLSYGEDLETDADMFLLWHTCDDGDGVVLASADGHIFYHSFRNRGDGQVTDWVVAGDMVRIRCLVASMQQMLPSVEPFLEVRGHGSMLVVDRHNDRIINHTNLPIKVYNL